MNWSQLQAGSPRTMHWWRWPTWCPRAWPQRAHRSRTSAPSTTSSSQPSGIGWSAGQAQAFDVLAANQNRFLASIEQLNNGDPSLNLPILPESFALEFSNLKAIWNDYDKHIATLVAEEFSVSESGQSDP